MINLLPTEVKQNIAYARHNRRLLRWAAALSFGVIGSAIIVAFGLYYINRSTSTYSVQVANSQTDLNNQKLPEVEQRVKEISSSLKLVVQVLSREILFSKLMHQVGAAIPANASLTGLSISKVSGGIDLTAIAADYDTATQVQVNLQDPANQIFEKADLINVSCAGSSTSDPRYPCTVTVRALFAKDNPFLFIGPKQAAAGSTP